MTPEMKNASPDGSVFSMIREHYDEMTLAQKRLADYILKNPDEAVQASISKS